MDEASDFDYGAFDLRELESQVNQLVSRTDIDESLRLQISEMEMLQSMFSNPGEFCVDNPAVLADINEYLDGRTDMIPSRLDYSLNLLIDEKLKVEVCINLAQDYPHSEPDLYVRSDLLSREQQHLLNSDLAGYVCSLERGELCIWPCVEWLQENGAKYLVQETPSKPKRRMPPKQPEEDDDSVFARYWIYSHHIYSKTKRREILELANEHNVTGFMLPGRPGIMCAEGSAPSCDDWWTRVRGMQWKRIVCKKIETYKTKSEEEFSAMKKFSVFEEIVFNEGKPKSLPRHMDMGEFFRYLQEHKCEDIFKDYFGVTGRVQQQNVG